MILYRNYILLFLPNLSAGKQAASFRIRFFVLVNISSKHSFRCGPIDCELVLCVFKYHRTKKASNNYTVLLLKKMGIDVLEQIVFE